MQQCLRKHLESKFEIVDPYRRKWFGADGMPVVEWDAVFLADFKTLYVAEAKHHLTLVLYINAW